MKLKRGKSKKETWKKLRSCEDIDQFLVDKREAEVRGDDDGDVNNSSSTFFFFDTKQSSDAVAADVAEEDASQVVVGPVDVSKLRCFAGIYRNPSAVKDPVVKRNAIKTKEKRVKVGLGGAAPKKVAAAGPYDLWGETTKTTPTKTDAAYLAYTSTSEPPLASRKSLRRVRCGANGYTPSLVPAIELPPGGLSVNPSFVDHQALLRSALDDVLAKKKNPQQPKKKKVFAPESIKPEDEADLKEEDEEEKVVVAAAPIRKHPPQKPKSKSARRKEGEERLKELARRKAKEVRRRESDVYKIKGMKRRIEEEERKRRVKQEEKMREVKQREMFGVKELSKFKFNEVRDQVALSSDLKLRLRELKGPAKDLLTDRFKSLQKRNVIEVRVKSRQKRKHRGKRYVRGSDKMDWEKSGEWNGVKVGHLFTQQQQQKKKKRT